MMMMMMYLGTHWIGGWVNPRTGLDDKVRTQIQLLMYPPRHFTESVEIVYGDFY